MQCLYHSRGPILTLRPDPTRKPPQDSVKEAVKDLATKASVEAIVKVSHLKWLRLCHREILNLHSTTQDNVKEAVKDLATKASVKELIKQGVENLARKVN